MNDKLKDDFLSGEDIKKLADYINNLQQENEKLKGYKSRIDEAIQYIKCHTFLHDDYGNEYYTMGKYFNPYWCIDILEGNDEGFETLKTFVDYKERVRKAIEYIEDTYMFDYENDDRLELKDQWYAKDILNILKGDRND